MSGAEGQAWVDLPWAVPVGILGTAADWLTQKTWSRPRLDSADPPSAVRDPHLDLHELFGQAAMILGVCCRRAHRHVLADAAMSVFAMWLVEVEKVVPARLGESADHLVHHWAADQSRWTVIRELTTAASVYRMRRLVVELGEEELGTLLRAELASSAHVSGTALALADYARMAESKEDGTRR